MILSNAIGKTISDKIGLIRGSSLKARSARGIAALAAGTFLGRCSRIIRNMVLARILAPDAFGLMAIVLVATSIFEAITAVGVRQSIVHHEKGADYDYLNMAWWLQVIRGFGIFLIATLAAPSIANFYDMPHLSSLLQVAFIAILFNSLTSPRIHVLEKEYKFGTAVLLKQAGGISGAIVAICLSFITKSVWVLVIGFVTEFIITFLLSYIVVPFVPSLKLHKAYLWELLRYARGMLGLAFLTLLAGKTDVIVLGKMVTSEQLGMYNLAAVLTMFPIMLFSQIVQPVMLTTFAHKQTDKDSLCKIFLGVTQVSANLIIPLAAFMVCCSNSILLLIYGSNYVSVAVPFAVLSLHIIPRIAATVFASIYMATGQPHLHRRFVILRALILVSLIYPATNYFGLLGAAAVLLLSNSLALLAQAYWVKRLIRLNVFDYFSSYGPGLLVALPIIAVVAFLQLFKITESSLVIFISGSLTLLIVLAGVMYRLYFWFMKQST